MGAEDIAVIWNSKIDRFQVYQVEPRPGLYDLEGYLRYDPRLIFTVQEKDGGYRPLDKRTLNMIAKSIELAHAIWDVPEEKRVAKLEKHEKDQYERQRQKRHDDLVEQMKDARKTLTRKTFGYIPRQRYTKSKESLPLSTQHNENS